MLKNLVIVESPAKAKTIEKFLGKDYKVMSSYGHIRDLRKKDISINVDSDFQPVYEIPAEKKPLVAELKKAAKEADTEGLAPQTFSPKSPRTLYLTPLSTPETSTCISLTLSRRAECLTVLSVSNCRRCCGKKSNLLCQPDEYNQWLCV